MSIAKRHIGLIGFSGSGKSTVGPLLAKKLGLRFVDVDTLIAREYGATIPNIFAREGERAFRRLESRMIGRTLSGVKKAAVIALGGGAFISNENRSLILDNSTVIWLSCSVREIHRRLRGGNNRPLLNVSPQTGQTMREARLRQIAALLSKRLPTYRYANIRVATTNRTTQQVVSEILRQLRRFDAAS